MRHLDTVERQIAALLFDLSNKHMAFFSACRQNIEHSRVLLAPSILWDAWWPCPAHMLWAMVINKAESSKKIFLLGQVGVSSFCGQKSSAAGITCTRCLNRLRHWRPIRQRWYLFSAFYRCPIIWLMEEWCIPVAAGWNWEMRWN